MDTLDLWNGCSVMPATNGLPHISKSIAYCCEAQQIQEEYLDSFRSPIAESIPEQVKRCR